MLCCRRFNTLKQARLLAVGAVAALAVAGCSHKPVNSYQGYIEGKFVYVASPVSGRLDQLAVARGETVDCEAAAFRIRSRAGSGGGATTANVARKFAIAAGRS